MDIAAARMIGAGLATLALLGAGIGAGNLFASYLSAVARNPSVKDELRSLAITCFVFVESIALIAFVVAMLILYV